MRCVLAVVLSLLASLSTGAALAQTGVGVNVGSISIDETLAPGGTYILPRIGVINTGQMASDYSLRVTHRADQPELRPPGEWFSFSPHVFYLEPRQTQTVSIRLNVPTMARPGDYFALVEAFPVMAEEPGVVIGVAAGTKLSFTVRPSNLFMASALWVYHRVDDAAPYSYLVAGLAGLALLVYGANRFLRLQIRLERRK